LKTALARRQQPRRPEFFAEAFTLHPFSLLSSYLEREKNIKNTR
jgi:hypothetical protein